MKQKIYENKIFRVFAFSVKIKKIIKSVRR